MLFSRLAVTQRTIFSRFSLLRQYAASSENNANNIGSSGFLKYTILGTIFGAGIYGIYTNGAPTDQEIVPSTLYTYFWYYI